MARAGSRVGAPSGVAARLCAGRAHARGARGGGGPPRWGGPLTPRRPSPRQYERWESSVTRASTRSPGSACRTNTTRPSCLATQKPPCPTAPTSSSNSAGERAGGEPGTVTDSVTGGVKGGVTGTVPGCVTGLAGRPAAGPAWRRPRQARRAGGPGHGGTRRAALAGGPGPRLLHWRPTLNSGTFTGQSQAAWSVTGNADYVVVGGEFPTINGQAQQGLARFAVRSIAQLGRVASKAALEKRVGAFEPPGSQPEPAEAGSYGRFVQAVQTGDADPSSTGDGQRRAERRQQRAQAREALKARFEVEQQEIKEQRQQKRAWRTKRHAAERLRLRERLASRRGAFIAARMNEGMDAGMARSLWALEAAKERDALSARQGAEEAARSNVT